MMRRNCKANLKFKGCRLRRSAFSVQRSEFDLLHNLHNLHNLRNLRIMKFSRSFRMPPVHEAQITDNVNAER
jgi:hypothetical protein